MGNEKNDVGHYLTFYDGVNTMTIKIRYFASLRERLGRSEDTLPFEESLTVSDVWYRANADQALPVNILASVNMDYVALDSIVQDNDEVAFFPPVTGG
jgi:molybdopterin synthase sulfur carrier subunit